MTRHSRKRGGGKFEDIQTQIDSIQEQLNELKKTSSEIVIPESVSEPVVVSESVSVSEPVVSKSSPTLKTWVFDKTDKFNDGNSGRVALAFGRIITLLDNNIKKGDNKKNWSEIKEKLNNANSRDEVQDIIKEYKMNFSSNYVAGTKRRRKNNGKKMSRKNK
jgi:hypothetical protein